jgi:hypothetical protein
MAELQKTTFSSDDPSVSEDAVKDVLKSEYSYLRENLSIDNEVASKLFGWRPQLLGDPPYREILFLNDRGKNFDAFERWHQFAETSYTADRLKVFCECLQEIGSCAKPKVVEVGRKMLGILQGDLMSETTEKKQVQSHVPHQTSTTPPPKSEEAITSHQMLADLDEDFSKITSRGPSRKRSKSCVVEYKYGSSGRMYHTRGNRQPRRTAGNMETNSKRTSGSSEDNRLQGLEESVVEGDWQDSNIQIDSVESNTAIDDALDELRGVLGDVDSIHLDDDTDSPSVWQERMERREGAWEIHRPAIFELMMKYSYMPHKTKCQFCSNEACLRCLDCGPWFFLCCACDSALHAQNPYHDREAWLKDYLQPIPPKQTVNTEGKIVQQVRCILLRQPEQCPLCLDTEGFNVEPLPSTRIIVSLKGRYELNDAILICCSCGGRIQDSVCPLDSIDRGFWPGSPQRKSKYLFDLKLFEQYHFFQLHCPGLSEAGFLKSLAMYSRMRGRVSCQIGENLTFSMYICKFY